MMGSCAFLMPVGSLQFVRKNGYNLRAALGLAVGGPLAVLIAAFIVEVAAAVVCALAGRRRGDLHRVNDAARGRERAEGGGRTGTDDGNGIEQSTNVRYGVPHMGSSRRFTWVLNLCELA